MPLKTSCKTTLSEDIFTFRNKFISKVVPNFFLKAHSASWFLLFSQFEMQLSQKLHKVAQIYTEYSGDGNLSFLKV